MNLPATPHIPVTPHIALPRYTMVARQDNQFVGHSQIDADLQVGRREGYATRADAMRAAYMLSRGEDRPAVVVSSPSPLGPFALNTLRAFTAGTREAPRPYHFEDLLGLTDFATPQIVLPVATALVDGTDKVSRT